MSGYGWIGVDLDGTLAHYEGWEGHHVIGRPIGPMVERVKGWLAEGKDVRIFTARVSVPEAPGFIAPMSQTEMAAYAERMFEADRARRYVQLWCADVLGRVLPVTANKDRYMIQLWDDRCVRVQANIGLPCCKGDKDQLCL